MLELSMTSLGNYQDPADIPQQPEDVAHFHTEILSHVEPEVHHVPFLHYVVLAFQS